ncbi:protein LOWER TEMPERATURE 1 [Physcomitrium patens]|uniref:SAP domain-containing protein n=1 Tax=Physcomitrium patens TaxID=3218 RepID=A0A2K1K6Q6_PHYPA|nr:uncharacterized protein LOC112285281 [Physcomitrium patens]PNR49461.1 hypothetical protein PHYPA_011357 [Physcomitrium patens]|eukprot:XP_024381726.1 uncharacterized protein LOC112285281 [Physcomitrella patens]
MAGAAQFLSNLPSRGCFVQPATSTSGQLTTYICQHDTSPPDEQLIKTDSTNILIRALTLGKKKGKGEPKSATKDNKGKVPATEESKGKRPAERLPEEKPILKRANVGGASAPEGGTSRYAEKDLQTLTVQKLKSMLKEKGLPLKGLKDELIARLLNQKR